MCGRSGKASPESAPIKGSGEGELLDVCEFHPDSEVDLPSSLPPSRFVPGSCPGRETSPYESTFGNALGKCASESWWLVEGGTLHERADLIARERMPVPLLL